MLTCPKCNGDRITSYNVCYTKLLRVIANELPTLKCRMVDLDAAPVEEASQALLKHLGSDSYNFV